eukprot:GFUD01107645.1.p1 GENE.GFUD01107645.1~~GFUD01107645.1.p1  ORF type:complete len:677 (-),score=148.47 GFUD01107645.1:186-2216(-)
MAGEAILVDLSDPTPTSAGTGAPLNLLPKKKGRSSFYSLPKNLSEDDDPFGILSFQSKMEIRDKEKLDDLLGEREILREEPSLGMLVQIEADSPKYSFSESHQSMSSITSLSGTSHLLGLSALTSHQSISQGASALGGSALGISTSSAHGVSGLFGNLSKISTASQPPNCTTPSFSTCMSDDVFGEEISQADSKADDEPNWDKMMNEAQFVALNLRSDPILPMKTPVAHSRLAHAMSHYSPCESVESPTALLDNSRNKDFLVQLTPENSPKKVLTDEFEVCGSPKLMKSDLVKDDHVNIVEEKKELVEVVAEQKGLSEESEAEDRNLLGSENSEPSDLSVPNVPVKETPNKRRLASIKENMEPPKPRAKTEVKKPLLSRPRLNSAVKPKLILKPPGSEPKRQPSEVRKTPGVLKPLTKNTVSATPNNSKQVSTSATPNIKNPVLTSASKSLKFTPKNTGFRVAKRPNSTTSNSGTPSNKTSTTTDATASTNTSTSHSVPQLTATVATPNTAQPQVPGVKRLNPPKPRSNLTLPAPSKTEPAKLSMAKPSGPARPSSMTRPSGLARPGAGLNSTLGSLPRPNLGSMPRPNTPGIQRPGVKRQGSGLAQSMLSGSRFSTPSLKRGGGLCLPNRSGLCLPSPQTLSANSSLVCSTPAAPRPRQAKGPLPSPITNVKRRV